MNKLNQKGVSALFAILILSIMMAMVLGLTTIVATQIRTIKGIGDSIVAFYAADAGIEYMLNLIIGGTTPSSSYSGNLAPNISYEISVECCGSGSNCVYLSGGCPAGLPINLDCAAPRYCIKSVGKYSSGIPGDSRKALEVEI